MSTPKRQLHLFSRFDLEIGENIPGGFVVLLSLLVLGGIHGVPHGERASATGSDGFDAVEIVESVVEGDEASGRRTEGRLDGFVRIGEEEIAADEFVV